MLPWDAWGGYGQCPDPLTKSNPNQEDLLKYLARLEKCQLARPWPRHFSLLYLTIAMPRGQANRFLAAFSGRCDWGGRLWMTGRLKGTRPRPTDQP